MDCSICLEKVPDKGFFETNCHHKYHKKCITVWLKEKNTCPVCRTIQSPHNIVIVPKQPDIVININNSPVVTLEDEHRKRINYGLKLFCLYFIFSAYNLTIVSLVKSVNDDAFISQYLLGIFYIMLWMLILQTFKYRYYSLSL